MRETAGEDFPRIIAWKLGMKPEAPEPGADADEPVPATAAWSDIDDSDVPF